MPRLIGRTASATPTRPARPRARRGFTVIELMVTVVLFGLVMASLMGVLARQQRFYRGTNEVIDTRSQLRQAASVLPSDLRGLSTVGLDLKTVSDTMIEFMATYGTAVMCTNSLTSYIVTPDSLSRHTLTSWLWKPTKGDTAFILDEGPKTGSEDDKWLRRPVDSVSTTMSGCDVYMTSAELTTKRRYKVWMPATAVQLTSTVVAPGAVVRFARPVRYRFYRGGDNNWYLGYQAYTYSGLVGAWSSPQPLAGPYRPYVAAGDPTNGLRFLFYNQAGTQVTATDSAARVSIARIDVSLKGRGNQVSNTAISSNSRFRDSLLVRIAIRNRS